MPYWSCITVVIVAQSQSTFSPYTIISGLINLRDADDAEDNLSRWKSAAIVSSRT